MSNVHFLLTIYSHHFVLSKLSPVGRMLANKFAIKFVQYSLVPAGGMMHRKATKVFATATNDRSEFRFHINQLKDFYKHLLQYGYDNPKLYTTIHVPVKKSPDVSFEVDPKYVPRDYQVPIIEYVSKPEPKCKLVGLQTGGGKAQKLSELIKVPGGWKKMADVKVGDIVIAKDGLSTSVTGVYPQGKVQLYKMVFSDGRSTECCGEHLWKVYYNENTVVINTLDVLELLKLNESIIEIDLVDPEDSEDVLLPIEAYKFGISIGSGVSFSIDNELFDPVNEPGLQQYIHSSKSQRFLILKGILDYKNQCNLGYTDNAITFSNNNYQLVKIVQYLVRSLGGIAKIETLPELTHTVYKTNIKLSSVFNLVNTEYVDSNKTSKIGIVDAYTTEVEEAQCISIAHPDKLYVTTDFIVTHNTFVALSGIAVLGKIPCIVVKPAYIEKWTDDLIKTYNLGIEDIMVIQGSKHLLALLNKVKEGTLEYKAIIISNKTFQLWLTMYEKLKDETLDMGYCILPHEFFEHIGAGVRLIDEVHQDFHFNFKLDLYTNVEHAISLSATLITQDPFLRHMHELAYPISDRYVSPPLDKYISSYAVHYRFKQPDKIRTSEHGSSNYSHGALEKSIMKHPPTVDAYLALIDYTLNIGYFKATKKGKKCIIFAYSVDMCTRIARFLDKKYPGYKVSRYVADDPYEHLMESDVVVSTLGSAGTAVDIPNLTNVILTTAIDSIQSNVQSLGRLRKLDDGNTETEFHYFVCSDIDKHLIYHSRKKEMLSNRAKSFIDVYSGFTL